MSLVDVKEEAAQLPDAWRSVVLGRVGTAAVKVLRMDGRELEAEVHGTAEVLFVADGVLELEVEGEGLTVGAGKLCRIPAGARHAVRAGSRGTLLIVEVAEGE
ncbi:cupin domain-containing protein [Kitasatospora cathayae]|uniref:Cupin domain-containing protein n=1 Tax=Kitasatospora cathayae TaxID=3004092 RepID=A0ABY7QA13_9ACTN|nr:cupin domain-containing protein [Kitasatospora sp. HUAS 3-15]WBP89583.1 cupin domain-containing protein [Kitasatospora sp. HUAS 3-15]